MPAAEAEAARAAMLMLFPEGFEEVEADRGVELVAYTDGAGEEQLWRVFSGATAVDVANGWETRWREFHRPTRVGRLWIGPPWERPSPPGSTAIVIDPGRAFGTGAHATTRLCLELLLRLEPGSLLDIGCGSGVLAIAAAKLGFSPVVAIDHDAAAVEAATRNASANDVRVELRLQRAEADSLPRVDVALANIVLKEVVSIAGQLECEHLITSGYLSSDEPDLPGFRRLERNAREGWAADLFCRELPTDERFHAG